MDGWKRVVGVEGRREEQRQEELGEWGWEQLDVAG